MCFCFVKYQPQLEYTSPDLYLKYINIILRRKETSFKVNQTEVISHWLQYLFYLYSEIDYS